MLASLQAFLGRSADRPLSRPPDLPLAFGDRPAPLLAFGLALQMLAVQSIQFIMPVAAAASITSDVTDIARFLALSILAAAWAQTLQALRRGPIGAGYPLPGTPAALGFGVFAVAGATGSGFAGIAAATLLAGLGGIGLVFALRHLRALLPDEVSGVVVMMIGVTLVGVATSRLGLDRPEALPSTTTLGVALATLALISGIGLAQGPSARFSVLIGASLATPLALWLGEAPAGALDALAAAPWFALPRPWWPDFAQLHPSGLGAMLVSLLALMASAFGLMVVVQRTADARWSRPDLPPLRRGMLATGAGVALSGLIGGMPPTASASAVSLSVATGTLALRIVHINTLLLLGIAFCPKAAALFVLIPASVQAAMLFFVAGYIAAQGAKLLTTRLLDQRRMFVAALGLTAGLAAALAPHALLAGAAPLASPVLLGTLVAFLANLVTLPLVGAQSHLVVTPGAGAGRTASAWVARLGGGWALKPETARAADQAVGELLDLLAEQRVNEVRLEARRAEARISITLEWVGERLPDAARNPHASALLGEDAERRAFAVWLATRGAQRHRQSVEGGRVSLRLDFED